MEWYHNGKPLPFGNRWRTSYDFGFAALDIIGAYAEDSGCYTLKVVNALGSAESSIDVKISCEYSCPVELQNTHNNKLCGRFWRNINLPII